MPASPIEKNVQNVIVLLLFFHMEGIRMPFQKTFTRLSQNGVFNASYSFE